MKITADTNVLIRAVTLDHPTQSPRAVAALAEAEMVAITLPTICEFVWVLAAGYKLPRKDIARAIRSFLTTETISLNRQAVEAGLALMDDGADFADGVSAYEGRQLGGETFLSFDKRAVESLRGMGIRARTP